MSQELNEERTSFEREVLSKNEKIADLKERLQEKKSETAIELRYLAKESKGTCRHLLLFERNLDAVPKLSFADVRVLF